MASAGAKFIGEVGLRYATSMPGAAHLLTGLYDADMDHVSLMAICFQQAQGAIGASYQQEVDLLNLFKDLTSECVASGMIPAKCAPWWTWLRRSPRPSAGHRHHPAQRPATEDIRKAAREAWLSPSGRSLRTYSREENGHAHIPR